MCKRYLTANKSSGRGKSGPSSSRGRGSKTNRKRTNEDNGFAEWGGYMEAKKAKLLDQFRDDNIEKVSDIFNGVEIMVNGFTNPSANELKSLMAAHGGVYHMYPSSKITHIIASNLPNVKIKHLGSVPIVKPAWITESIALGKLVDYRRYLLYTNQSTTQPALNFPVVPKASTDPIDNNNDALKNENGCCLDDKTESSPAKSKQVHKLPKTASDPNFIEEFYNNSRLHLISTLGAEFKLLISKLREKSDGKFPGLEKLITEKGKPYKQTITSSVIMHIDMDCFFVSVGLRNHPELKGKPVAITHAKKGQVSANPERKAIREREFQMYLEKLPEGVTSRVVELVENIDEHASMSEIASCSYEARKYGIKNGMFLGTAIKLCPELKTLPYDFEGYKEVSHKLYSTIASYTLDMEAVSCDEMYVDVTNILKSTGLTVDEWASHIRDEITHVTGCPCSTGFGANRLQARLATRKAKPNGQFYLHSDDVESYMAEIPLSDLPGVGRATLAKLNNLGLKTCGDVQTVPLRTLQQEVGMKVGETIKEQSRGIDNKPLNYNHERKSVSAEINYGIRFKTVEECYNFLQSLSQEVYNRLSEINMRARCLTLKLLVRAEDAPLETAKYLGHGVCDAINKSTTSNSIIDDPKIIYREAKSLYDKLNVPFEDLRGVGIQLSKLEKSAPVNKALSNFLRLGNVSSTKQETEKVVKNHESESVEELRVTVDESSRVSVNKIQRDPVTSQVDKKSNRGRPKGKTSKKSGSTTVVKQKNTISTMFKKREITPLPIENVPVQSSSTIDLNVLNELPEAIRMEIIKDYQLENQVSSAAVKKLSDVNDNTVVTVKSQVKCQKEQKPKKSHFDGLSWDEVKPVVKTWISSESAPANVDVEMLAVYFRQMAIDRKIESLKCAFNFLHRIFSNLDCNWHRAYFTMVNIMQEGMVSRYGNTLLVNRKFLCCNIQDM